MPNYSFDKIYKFEYVWHLHKAIVIHRNVRKAMQEGKALDAAYMAIFGELTKELSAEELTYSFLHKKKKLIQTALNRNEVPNIKAIEEEAYKYISAEGKQEVKNEEAFIRDFYIKVLDNSNYDASKIYEHILKKYYNEDKEINRIILGRYSGLAKQLVKEKDGRALYFLEKILEMARNDDMLLDLLESNIINDNTLKENEVFLTDKEIEGFTLAKEISSCFGGKDFAVNYSDAECQSYLESLIKWQENAEKYYPFTIREVIKDSDLAKVHKELLQQRIAEVAEKNKRLYYQINDMALEE